MADALGIEACEPEGGLMMVSASKLMRVGRLPFFSYIFIAYFQIFPNEFLCLELNFSQNRIKP